MNYTVRFAHILPGLRGDWNGRAWQQADTLEIAHFRPESSNHRPQTFSKLLYNDEGIFGIFLVRDRYVRCRHTRFMEPVYKDSCVEFFVQPEAANGYFNFEFNCGGTLLASYIIDPARTPGGFRNFISLPKEDGGKVTVYHSLPEVIEPEVAEPIEWILEFFVPFDLLGKYAGSVGTMKGRHWRANFYKCADETSHPHWASWAPVDELNFHLPSCFGTLIFE